MQTLLILLYASYYAFLEEDVGSMIVLPFYVDWTPGLKLILKTISPFCAEWSLLAWNINLKKIPILVRLEMGRMEENLPW